MNRLHDYLEIGGDARMEIVELTNDNQLKATLSLAKHSRSPVLRV